MSNALACIKGFETSPEFLLFEWRWDVFSFYCHLGSVGSTDKVKQNEKKDRVLRDGSVDKGVMFSYLLIRQIITAYNRLLDHPP